MRSLKLFLFFSQLLSRRSSVILLGAVTLFLILFDVYHHDPIQRVSSFFLGLFVGTFFLYVASRQSEK